MKDPRTPFDPEADLVQRHAEWIGYDPDYDEYADWRCPVTGEVDWLAVAEDTHIEPES
jgi:hypothetical protein